MHTCGKERDKKNKKNKNKWFLATNQRLAQINISKKLGHILVPLGRTRLNQFNRHLHAHNKGTRLYEFLHKRRTTGMEPRLNEWIMALLVQAKRGTYWPISCPLPVEPLFGRDPIHPPIILQEMISPRHERHYWTWQEPNCLPHRVLNVTLMWLRSVTEWILWQSCLCTWNASQKKKKGAWYAGPSDTSIHYLCAHNYIFLLIFKCMLDIPWKELVFELKPCRSRLIQGVNWASTAIIHR